MFLTTFCRFCCAFVCHSFFKNYHSKIRISFQWHVFHTQVAIISFHGIYSLICELKSSLFSFQNISSMVDSIFKRCSPNLLQGKCITVKGSHFSWFLFRYKYNHYRNANGGNHENRFFFSQIRFLAKTQRRKGNRLKGQIRKKELEW